MCGIAGFVGLPFSEHTLTQMLSTMMRRGPDDHNWMCAPGCVLLHSRLAIIDIEKGKQPMHLSQSGERYSIVYNGELYNTDEVRNELKKLGHTFCGHSDTEVVLHAYVQWKEQTLTKLNGIFAFAVWEHKAEKLFLARDRMGVKPLFFKLHEGGLLFASEIKTILKYPSVKAELDAEGAAELLLLGPGRTPGSGVFRGIAELQPGYYACYQNSTLSKTQYWKLKDREHTESFEQTVERVRFLVTDSIVRQMVSDVPIGTFLSGGLDSSIISAVCAQKLQSRGEILQTFSVDYVDNDKYFVPGKFQPNSDNHYIEIMKENLSCAHEWTVLTPEDLLEDLENATVARDLPGMADVDISLLAFCRRIKKNVKVALSGECADEIFGGYPWYRDPAVRESNGFPWAQNTKQRAAFLTEDIAHMVHAEEFVNSRYEDTIHACDILPGNSPQERRMKEMVNLNHYWFMQTLLDRKDRMSMYSGLEVRVPFCDYRIAEYLYGVPWEFKDYQGQEKGILRYAMRGILPKSILYRKKSPYPKTLDPRYFHLVKDRLQSVLKGSKPPILQIVNKEALEDLLNAEYAWPWYGQLMRVPQTIAYMLQLNFWLEKYKVSVV